MYYYALIVAFPSVKSESRRFLGFLISGICVCLLSAYTNSFFMAVSGLSYDDTAVFITPVCEEILKLLPLLFYFLVFEPSPDSLFSSAVAVGVGFATFENCCYLLSSGAGNISFVLIRGLSAGVMHTICALAAGYGLIYISKVKQMAAIGALGILALTVTYHAVFNLLVSVEGITRYVGFALPLATALCWFAFIKKIKVS